MKKIFQIAAYDFKRLTLNPFTMITVLVVIVACLILSATYKIPTTPEYKAQTDGQTTKVMYENYHSTNPDLDTATSVKVDIEKAKLYLSVQKECDDHKTLVEINRNFRVIEKEVNKYGIVTDKNQSTYIINNNIDEIKDATKQLSNFVERFKNLKEFESDLIFKNYQFENLENLSNYFNQTVNQNVSISKILDNLYENIDNFQKLNLIVENEVTTWDVDPEKLQYFQMQYIDKAETKITNIDAEIERLYNTSSSDNTANIPSMQSLITNMKLTCESAHFGILYELKLLLYSHFGNLDDLYNYQSITVEDTKLSLIKVAYYLDDESVYYTQYQVPLNFNTASYQITVYDNTYFIMSIVGFATIIFGIFCAYKLFGRDRRNGKMDIILSQNVTFGQVFAGKFTAIVFVTSALLAIITSACLVWALLFYNILPNGILAVFNLNCAYTIHPFLFLLIKFIGIELQVIFYAILTIFLMNISRKFELTFAIALTIFAVATICNIFLNWTFIYCLFPFIHADLTSFIGGGTMATGFLKTSLYSYGNFFISLAYYSVVVILLYNFTNQLFKKN